MSGGLVIKGVAKSYATSSPFGEKRAVAPNEGFGVWTISSILTSSTTTRASALEVRTRIFFPFGDQSRTK